MTISEINTQDDAVRFPSLDSLRAAHTELLKRFRANGRTPEMVAEIERFIHRGRATGALLDADADRWAAQSQLDYWSTQLYQPGYEPPDATLDEFDPELAPELDDSLCPYVGLDAFREDNEFVFFGRRRLIGELVDELKNSRFLAVLGSSGSGKSSVVRAGLIPELKRGALPGSEAWHYFPPMVPGSHPLVNLARLLDPPDAGIEPAEAEAESFRENPDCLPQTVKERFDQDVVLVIDQFEEIFTLCTDEVARQRFVENLIALCKEPDTRHRVVITMRSDFEMNIARLPKLQDLFEKHVVRITPLSAAELREAIEAPAARIGLKFEEGVVDALLSDTLGEPAALPLLQFTLLKLWERREKNRVTWESYRKLGGGRQALANSADQVYLRLIPEQRITMRRILLKMVRPGEGLEVTSNRVPRASLYQKAEANDRIDRVLERLIKERLVRRSEGDMAGDEQVEIAHEALVRNWPRLVEWLEEERVTLRQRQRLTAAAEEWQRLDRDPSALWRGVLLEEVKRYDDLNDLEKEFVAAGADAELAERKQLEENASRMRKRAYYLTAALAATLIAVFAAIRFGMEARQSADEAKIQAQIADSSRASEIVLRATAVANAAKAERQTEIELARRLASQAQVLMQDPENQTVGLLLAIQSMRMNPSGEAAQVLQNGFHNNSLVTPLMTQAHDGPVNYVEFTQKGQQVVSVSGDGTIRVWEALSGNEIARFNLDGGGLPVALSPNGRFVAVVSSDQTLHVWELDTGREVARLANNAQVYSLAFSPDGTHVAIGGDDATAHVWDLSGDNEIPPLLHDGAVYKVAFSPDGKLLATAGADRRARVWSIEKGIELAHQTYEGEVYDVAFSPDNKYVVTGVEDGTASVWNAVTGLEITSLAFVGPVYKVMFSPDGRYIVSGSDDGAAHVWDVFTGAEISRQQHGNAVTAIAISQDGKYVISGDLSETVYVWETATAKQISHLTHNAAVYSVAFSPDGQYVVTGGEDGTAKVWQTVTRNELAGQTHDGWVTAAKFSPDGEYVVSASSDGTARVWESVSGNEISSLPHSDMVYRAAFSPDGKNVVTGSFDSTVRVWDAATGELRTEMTHESIVYSVAFSPDGKHVVSGSDDRTARVWDAKTGGEVARMTYDGFVYAVAFSPDGQHVLSGGCKTWQDQEQSLCSSGVAQVWEAKTGKELSSVTHNGNILSVAFSPDGKYAASGGEDGTLATWIAATGKELFRGGHQGGVFALAFSPDGRWLVSGGEDGLVLVWDVATGGVISYLPYDEPVRSVDFSPDGQYVAVGSIDSTARVWGVVSGTEIGRTLHNDWVNEVDFSPDGKYVVSASDDGTARIWIWDPEELIKRVCSRLSYNLSFEAWFDYLEDREYEPACPDLPVAPEAGETQ